MNNRFLNILVILTTSLTLGACTGGPRVDKVIGTEPSLVRNRLHELREQGPTPLVLLGDIETATGLDGIQIASAASEGITGITTDFEVSDTQTGPRLLIGQGTSPLVGVCNGNLHTPSFDTLFTAFCDGERLLGGTIMEDVGDWRDDPTRLIWRSTRSLTQDDYERNYGVGIFGSNVGVSIGGSVGF